jgi:hypothetical protein
MPIPCEEADIKSPARELDAHDANGSGTRNEPSAFPNSIDLKNAKLELS